MEYTLRNINTALEIDCDSIDIINSISPKQIYKTQTGVLYLNFFSQNLLNQLKIEGKLNF